ncbi:hypothetical protein IFM89_022475, partial [Coptis chinensis]
MDSSQWEQVTVYYKICIEETNYRSAIEMVEAELRDSSSTMNLPQSENASSDLFTAPLTDCLLKQETNNIVLCSMVKLFRGTKKDTTVGELNRSYIDLSKLAQIPPTGFLEFLNMCRVLSDQRKLTNPRLFGMQGIFKMGQSRDDRSKRVTLKVDELDIIFALQVRIK